MCLRLGVGVMQPCRFHLIYSGSQFHFLILSNTLYIFYQHILEQFTIFHLGNTEQGEGRQRFLEGG